MTTNATSRVQIDNDRVRVTEWRFAPGAETGWHVHEMEYVVVPLVDGLLRVDTGESVTDTQMYAGRSYSRPIGVSHNVANPNVFEYAFVEVELKS